MTYRVIVVVAALMLGAGYPAAHAARPSSGGTQCPADTQAFAPQTGAELQLALDCAEAGATITLASGQLYEGNFTLRHKAGASADKRITIKSDALGILLGQTPQRVDPASDESYLAWLKVPSRSSSPVLSTELKTQADGTTRLAASHYHLAGIKFFSNHWVNHLVRLGTATEKLVSELPEDLTFDRSYFAGSSGEGTKQGLVANGRNIVVTNSYFKDFKDTANDAQAIIIWNGAGPYRIENNYLEGSGENMMVGGGDPTIVDLVPTAITIRGNYFFKPPRWIDETSTQRGSARGKKWRIKNLFELKNAQDVVFEGNVLENNWIQADQQGFAILFSPRNQSGGCSWCRIQRVTLVNNLVRNSIAGMKLLATDYTNSSQQLQDVTIANNLLINIRAGAFPETDPGDRAGRLIQFMNPYPSISAAASPTGPINVTIAHNTAFSDREFSFSVWDPVSGVTFANNVARHNPCTSGNNCGISGDGTAPGGETFDTFFRSLWVSGNILFDAGGDRTEQYSKFSGDTVFTSDNTFPASVTFESGSIESGSIDPVTGIATGSDASYTVVTSDGRKVGADWSVLKPIIDAAISGTLPQP